MDKSQAELLLNKYNRGEASELEVAILESWYMDQGLKSPVFGGEIDYSAKRQRILANIQAHRAVKAKRVTLWPRIAVAASIALVISIGGYFYYHNQSSRIQQNSTYVNDMAPGKVGATLTLANGKKIRLADAGNGELANDAGVVVTKAANGQLIYTIDPLSPSERDKAGIDQINTLSTAQGETYQVRLPDGSSVWLNAASSLTYAANLNDKVHAGQRRVKLEGEAYFEIAKDKARPFIVESKNQQVEVLGTHFNIHAYSDENSIQTTLLEGSVKIGLNNQNKGATTEKTLKPNQQAILTGNVIRLADVTASDAIAWKEGYFLFNRERLESVLQKIARWYNIKVIYDDPGLKDETILGTMSRYEHLSKVLILLKRTGVATFEMEGNNTIHVKKK